MAAGGRAIKIDQLPAIYQRCCCCCWCACCCFGYILLQCLRCESCLPLLLVLLLLTSKDVF